MNKFKKHKSPENGAFMFLNFQIGQKLPAVNFHQQTQYFQVQPDYGYQ